MEILRYETVLENKFLIVHKEQEKIRKKKMAAK